MNITIKKFLCTTLVATNCLLADAAETVSVIPQPQNVKVSSGEFELTAKTKITFAGGEDEAKSLAAMLRKSTGFKLPVSPVSTLPDKSEITLLLQTNQLEKFGAEGYELSVSPKYIGISAATKAGLFYGGRTLLQLLPPEIFSANSARDREIAWTIPCVEISDAPRFAWRGLMLDVSRHFFTKAEVEKVLDLMSLYKLNTFHWHLVDDQGWRIQIKKYPRLTGVSAWRDGIGFGLDPKSATAYDQHGRYGGFYTQRDIREVVAYAAARHITIVPEIEMPGHSSAALRAYPQFLCPGVKIEELPQTSGDFTGVYCAGNDATFAFLDNILSEVSRLFPGKYIHIGGDEVVKSNWMHCALCQTRIKTENLKDEKELQAYFTRRIEKIVNAHGKTLIGWSEIREGGLAPSAALMDWIGGGAESATNGHDVVMSPTANCYLDYYQSHDHITEPHAIGGFLPLQKVYALEPVPAKLAPEFQRHILGAQGNVWTEFIPNLKHLEYMIFPRLSALAEVTWSPKETRNFDDYLRRLKADEPRLDQLGANYRNSALGEGVETVKVGGWKPAQIKTGAAPLEWNVTTNVTAGQSVVTFDYTRGDHGLDIAWAALLEDGVEISRDTHAGLAGISPRQPVYTLDVPALKPGAHYILRAQVAGDGGTDSRGDVLLNSKPASSK